MKISREYSVTQRGVGKPDYSTMVSAAIQRSGLYLEYNQRLKTFAYLATADVPHPYPIPWVKPPIAIGGSAHAVDIETGLALPYTVPAGYILTIIQRVFTGGSEDYGILIYIDGLLFTAIPYTESGIHNYDNLVIPYTTAVVDPTGVSAHFIDGVIVNRGGGTFSGGVTYCAILEAVGTHPLPDTKDCQCPFCGHIQQVNNETTVIVCDNCSKTYYVHDLSRIRRL